VFHPFGGGPGATIMNKIEIEHGFLQKNEEGTVSRAIPGCQFGNRPPSFEIFSIDRNN
jgi:hypothetical protein